MTYCCNSIQRAKELIIKAGGILNWSEDFGAGDAFLSVITVGLSSNIKQAGDLREVQNRMNRAYNTLVDAQNAINNCSCGSQRDSYKNQANDLVNKYNNLNSNSTKEYNKLVGEWNELKDKHNNFVEEYKKDIADYNKLIGKHDGLQERFDDLAQRFDRLNEDNEELKQKNEEMRNRHEAETREWHQNELRLSRNEERLRQEGVGLREQLTDTRRQLTDTRGERNNLLIRVDERDRSIQTLTNQVADLRIESGERNTQLQVARQELTRTQGERDERITPVELQELINNVWQKEEEVSTLREQLSQSRESNTTETLHNREQRLESFVRRLGINWQRVRNLRNAYEQLIRVRQNYNRNNIIAAENNIETIKEQIIIAAQEVRFEDIQEIYDKCREIAQLRIQLEQQSEARIEVPPRH